MVLGAILPYSTSEPRCLAQFLYALTWDSLLLCLKSTGLPALRCHSTLGWDHLYPVWYPALTHRVEGALSQRVLDRTTEVELEPQPKPLSYWKETPHAKPSCTLLSPMVDRLPSFLGDLPWSRKSLGMLWELEIKGQGGRLRTCRHKFPSGNLCSHIHLWQ